MRKFFVGKVSEDLVATFGSYPFLTSRHARDFISSLPDPSRYVYGKLGHRYHVVLKNSFEEVMLNAS